MLLLEHVTKCYGDRTAVSDISLEVHSGGIGLLGPNGAGKSTLMRIVATLAVPDSGSVTFDNIDALANPVAVRERLGYLPQDFGFYPRCTGIEILEFLAALRGIKPRRERVMRSRHLLERVNLGNAADVKVSAYSHGMRQRLGIAQSLLANPSLLVVDEPTAGLDPQERLRLHELLAEISQESVLILSTHIVSDVAMLCSRLAVIDQGRLVADSTPAEAVRLLDGQVFEGVVINDALPELSERATVLSKVRVSSLTTRLRIHCTSAPPSGFQPTPHSLEDAYFALVGAAAGRS